MMIHYVLVAFLFLQVSSFSVGASFKLPTPVLHGSTHKSRGTRWAVLVAGSLGYENYRHQADVCHAYQTLRKGGLKEENIIVFMYDDIAFNKENPRPGVIINHPNGYDVYEGVPKDYIGDACNVSNLFAVLLANRTALKGGSGKVLDSGPDDHIFIYYADHGGAGVIEMPSGGFIYAKDLIDVLKKKHDNNTYKSMVFYMEACESGSMFEGLLPEGLNIYVTTASKAGENSYATYCSDAYHSISPGYDTCLGDVYSIAWLEDSDKHDLRSETLEKQYEVVRRRTSAENSFGSHVMQFGDMRLSKQSLYSYLGTNPVNDNYTLTQSYFTPSISESVSQRDASLLHFWLKFQRAPEDSHQRLEAQKQLLVELNQRMRIDQSMMNIGEFLFQSENEMLLLLHTARPKTQPLVEDWDCLKALVRTYEERCGSLSSYGIKYMRAIANMCNAGIGVQQMAMASAQACMK